MTRILSTSADKSLGTPTAAWDVFEVFFSIVFKTFCLCFSLRLISLYCHDMTRHHPLHMGAGWPKKSKENLLHPNGPVCQSYTIMAAMTTTTYTMTVHVSLCLPSIFLPIPADGRRCHWWWSWWASAAGWTLILLVCLFYSSLFAKAFPIFFVALNCVCCFTCFFLFMGYFSTFLCFSKSFFFFLFVAAKHSQPPCASIVLWVGRIWVVFRFRCFDFISLSWRAFFSSEYVSIYISIYTQTYIYILRAFLKLCI